MCGMLIIYVSGLGRNHIIWWMWCTKRGLVIIMLCEHSGPLFHHYIFVTIVFKTLPHTWIFSGVVGGSTNT